MKPNKNERALRHALKQMVDGCIRCGLQKIHGNYYNIYDFVVQHGKFYRAPKYPADYPRGAARACFGNSLIYAVRRGWKYVEGYASCRGLPACLPIHHAWNVDAHGKVWDTTWQNEGTAYLGIEFSIGRAGDAIWNGDTSVLDDWRRKWPLFQKRWQGEDWQREWEPSDGVKKIEEFCRR